MTILQNSSMNLRSDDYQFVKPQPRKHPPRSSIQHWQLRDLIACPQKRSEFYYVNQNNVNMYSTDTKQVTPFMRDLTFAPTSMTASCNYLAAGGQRSQLMVRNLNSTWFAQTTVGGSINNSLCISQHPRTTDSYLAGDTRLLVCNNDETIKVYSLPSLQRITTLGLPTAVNYGAWAEGCCWVSAQSWIASVSPDGRRLCAVGDSNQVFLFDITSSGFYQRIATLTATNDAGFSCSWNHSSEKLAVASQDGLVSVWDIRNISTSSSTNHENASSGASIRRMSATTASTQNHLQKDPTKLACVASSQHPQVKGACRSVKFSPSPSLDLLMFSEHVSYLNVVDARTFDGTQSIRVSPPGSDVHLSGISWSPDSRGIYVGLESTVVEYDVDTVSRRSFPTGTLI